MTTVRDWLAAAMAMGRSESQKIDTKSAPELSPQQQEAVDRGVAVVQRYGGMLLADAVGLGKTRVALSMARKLVHHVRRRQRKVEPVLFVVPARLRRNWERAIGAVGWQPGRDADVISHHRLSRRPWSGRPSLVVVDEAHRFRNPRANRSRHLAMITARSPPILVTATPVCTRRSDLLQLLSYFLTDELVESMVGMGLEAAFAADEAREFDVVEILEEVVIRRRRPDFGSGGRPAVSFEILRYEASEDETWLWQNLESKLRELSLAATGSYWPRGLLINNMLRMWESGPEALWRCIDELLHFHQRWLEAVAAGRSVERPQFRELFGEVDRRQQVFSFLYGAAGAEPSDESRRLDVERDFEALRAINKYVDQVRQSGSGMVDAIVAEVENHGSERFLIFSAYRAAAEAIFDALATRPGRSLRVGLVTGDEARATGLGRTTSEEILDRFVGTEREKRPRHRRLRIVVTTDCLAEGVNLQGCSKLILADLPYSPVKLEQRIGRIARPGSGLDKVTVYLPRPKSWTDSLGMRRRLGERLDLARSFGAEHRLAGAVTAADKDPTQEAGPLAAMTLEERLWRQLEMSSGGEEPPKFASVEMKKTGGIWARILIKRSVRRYVWIWIQADDKPPIVRLSEQLTGLARAADDEREIVEWEPDGQAWKTIQHWIQRRLATLEAARLAPPLLGAGSEPVRLWSGLKKAVRDGTLSADDNSIESWRRRLLRAQPPGIHYEMEHLMESKPEPEAMARFVEGLPEVKESQAVVIRCVAALRL